MVFTTARSTGSNRFIKLLEIYGAEMFPFAVRLQCVLFLIYVALPHSREIRLNVEKSTKDLLQEPNAVTKLEEKMWVFFNFK